MTLPDDEASGEQFRLTSIIRLGLADLIDTIEKARVRAGLTPAQARVAIMVTEGVPLDTRSWLAGHYSSTYETE